MRRPVDPAAWGVMTGFGDDAEGWRFASPGTVAAILEALGADTERPGREGGALVVRGRVRRRLPAPAEVVLEDGTVLPASAQLPAGIPLGYHTLRDDQGERPLIVSPGRCHLPRALHTWGWAVQLYALRSSSSWGIGDLSDLAAVARWSAAELDAGMLLINPLHATVPTIPQQPSPYFPSSRRWRNPLYLRVEDVPGCELLDDRLEPLVRAGHDLNRERLIDRDLIFRLKLEALERIWDVQPAEVRDLSSGGDGLVAYATHCALAEVHGPSWRKWPSRYRHPCNPAVGRFREQHPHRVAFHAWLQRLLDEQLAQASRHIPLVHDLAVGVDPEGADAWLWQDVLADGVSVGAPPDAFNRAGQDWALATFDPWRLRSAGYAPFIETIRASLSHAGALRLDHVMGLFRLYWIPRGRGPEDGAYVRYPSADLLDIVALESHRAGAWICGEDLGTVEAGVRHELLARRILSYRLLWFENQPPATYPEQAMAAVTTHDLPTIAGVWNGADLDAQRAAGVEPSVEGIAAIVRRILELTGLRPGAAVDDVVAAVYRALAEAPSMVLSATLDDALGVAERPNMPGTVDSWPNWRLALPEPLERVVTHPGPARVAAALGRRRH